MKTITAVAAATIAILPATALAEGKGNHDWAEKAARGYEYKAKEAEKAGMPRAAAIYQRMAEIKREAGVASKQGKKFSWDEYHALEGRLNAIKNSRKEHFAKKDHAKKDHGNGFLNAADNYRKQAAEARANGKTDKADIYNKLAEHKIAAANAQKNGKGYDWTEYKALQKKLHGGDCEKKATANKDCDKPNHDQKVKGEWNASEKPAGKLNIE